MDSETYKRLLKRPKLLEEENKNTKKTIVIDEIQKQPHLLDEVHRLIQKNSRLKEEQLLQKYIMISLDKEARITKDKIQVMPWEFFLKRLWKEELF